jgi:hypothetical protein
MYMLGHLCIATQSQKYTKFGLVIVADPLFPPYHPQQIQAPATPTSPDTPGQVLKTQSAQPAARAEYTACGLVL